MSWFEYESGHAWCESAYKYQTHPLVAEFANTVGGRPVQILILLLREKPKQCLFSNRTGENRFSSALLPRKAGNPRGNWSRSERNRNLPQFHKSSDFIL